MNMNGGTGTWQESCTLCPRNCAAARNGNPTGAFCGETDGLRLSWAGLHFGEEPPVTGQGGSGTVFVTGCNLRCSFCQNYQISREGMGKAVSKKDFASICLALEKAGAENINIVTGSHSVPYLAEGLREAREQGLSIPVLWNSSAYESTGVLKLLEGLVTVWLPDFKSSDPDFSAEVFRARDYPEKAAEAILYMTDTSPMVFNERGLLQSGVIMRHLSLPGRLKDTGEILRWFKDNLDGRALLSLMTQYTPVPAAEKKLWGKEPFPQRYTEENEYDALLEMLDSLQIDNGFLQELNPDSEWLPDFSRTQPFSSSLAKPVWHWKQGFTAIASPSPEP